MNLKIKAFIEKQKAKSKLQKEINKLYNQQVWEEYEYQGEEVGTQEELDKITASYDAQINELKDKLKTL